MVHSLRRIIHNGRQTAIAPVSIQPDEARSSETLALSQVGGESELSCTLGMVVDRQLGDYQRAESVQGVLHPCQQFAQVAEDKCWRVMKLRPSTREPSNDTTRAEKSSRHARRGQPGFMAGIGEAASIISFVSLSVKLFDGCVKGFVLLSAAHELGNRGDTLRCQLEWEHYHLNEWATTVGLFREPPELNVPYPPVVQKTLSNLEQLLTDATKLNQDYGLDVLITDEDIRDVQRLKRLFGRILDKNKPQFPSDTAKVYSRRNSAWKKLKWASVDAEKFRLLLKDIRYFNKQLQSLLHDTDQKQRCRDDNSLMRSIVSQTSDKTLLNVMSEPLGTVDAAIAASARLKQQGLLLELVGSPTHHSSASSSQTTLALPVAPSSRNHVSAMRPRNGVAIRTYCPAVEAIRLWLSLERLHIMTANLSSWSGKM